jgi:ABC-type bacteriocin/lantibiotic exporter with double-glycine peptidase domain
MFWEDKLKDVAPIKNIRFLPDYGYQFVLSNLGKFRTPFIILTLVRVASVVLSFSLAYIISSVLTNIATLTTARIFYFYLPLFVGAKMAIEVLDFFTRKYGEPFPIVYTDYTRARFYKTILSSNFHHLFNYSKERLNNVVGKYLNSVSDFLRDWVWTTPTRITTLILVMIVLFAQNPLVLMVNVFYFAVFMAISFRIARSFSPIAAEYSRRTVEAGSVVQSFTLHLNAVKSLIVGDLFEHVYAHQIGRTWDGLKRLKDFHAQRWFSQLNLFNFLYVGTLFYGVYQVMTGTLPLGFLVLIQWSYSNLWTIAVYAIEYYVSLIQQKEDARVVRNELDAFILPEGDGESFPAGWQAISMKDIRCSFTTSKGSPIDVRVPSFKLSKGDKVGIVGESGSGKSTVLNILLGLVKYSGQYKVDGQGGSLYRPSRRRMCLINNVDPLFHLSIRDNILLGSSVRESALKDILEGVEASDFLEDLDAMVGSATTNFSAGQLQRIRLARGLVQGADIYLLDEPFNGIDDETKAKVMAFMKKYLKGKTVILVTHDRDELKLVDRMYHMRGHTMVES